MAVLFSADGTKKEPRPSAAGAKSSTITVFVSALGCSLGFSGPGVMPQKSGGQAPIRRRTVGVVGVVGLRQA